MYKHHQKCRACGSDTPTIPTLKESVSGGAAYRSDGQLVSVFNLGAQPLANDFISPGGVHKGWAPLEVMFCPRCTLSQLSVVVDPHVLYDNYPYITSNSETMHRHFAKLLETVIAQGVKPKRILEIGSNDGGFLQWLGANAEPLQLVGIDPAENLSKQARAKGIYTICGMFDNSTSYSAQLVLADGVQSGFDVIFARHVFCHVDNWREFLHNLAVPSGKETLVCIEVPYVKDLLENGEFDTIYHEHTSYMSIEAMRNALNGLPWRLTNVVKFGIHGGAILLMLRRNDSGYPVQESVYDMIQNEGVDLDAWKRFSVKAKSTILSLSATVRDLVSQGKRVVGYGASAKSTVMVNACGFTRKHLEFICDNTPQKLWRLSPGTTIPIVDDGALMRELPDYAICFAWNFFDEIYAKEKLFREKGGKWILYHPEIKVV